jgi:hypothetical protein
MSTYSPERLMPIRLAASEIEYASAVVSVNIFGSIGIRWCADVHPSALGHLGLIYDFPTVVDPRHIPKYFSETLSFFIRKFWFSFRASAFGYHQIESRHPMISPCL